VTLTRLRSFLLTAAFVVFVAAAWWWFAPASIGGSTRYVETSGISMEPRFHTGDLAIVRPASEYKVGEVVAYWSTLLNTVVLHRIIAINGDHYVFKGDNNHFIDPAEPSRAQLLGKLWLRIPAGGRYLNLLHTPVVAATVCGVLGLLLLLSSRERKRRRGRRRQGPARSGDRGASSVNARAPAISPRVNFSATFIAAACAAAICLVVALVAFTRPSHRTSGLGTPYTQQMSFGYSAHVSPGLIYPDGVITTGDPIFLHLIRDLTVHLSYRVTSAAEANLAGTEEVVLHFSGPSGWQRNLVLVPPTHFTGDSTDTHVLLNLPHLQSLLGRIESLIGPVGYGNYNIAVEPVIHITGTVAAEPVHASFSPALGFQLQPGQLTTSGASTTAVSAASTPSTGPTIASSSQPTYRVSASGSVPGTATATSTLTVLGASIAIPTLRWIGLLGLALALVVTGLAYLRRRAEPFLETAHIQSQYGHMIVPIVAGEDLGWPAVDVPTIKALAKLAESGQRLILHSRSGDVDTYMVNDEGTVYRYQVRPLKVVWGEWSDPAAPVKAAA
jgi:signal peptidase I